MMEEGELFSFRVVRGTRAFAPHFIFFGGIFYFFPPLAYDAGTPCDEKHRNKNVWPYAGVH